ncbi:MAG: NUDIX hydrolase [Akkermansia sp.]|nr:NUDIX hydrolase [Akkermansia sp.]
MDIPRDIRKQLCEQLLDYIARTPERTDVAERVLKFVCSTPDCFERSHESGHITGSAWLINRNGDKTLLTLHRKLKLWVQPGGHADGDGDVLRVAMREAQEESGIADPVPLSTRIYDIDIHTIPARPQCGEPEHLHYDIRYLLQAPHEQYVISDESDALGWFSMEELLHLTPPADAAVLRLAALWPQAKQEFMNM